jgi:uncharacterized protein (DUF2267 family)
MTSGHANFDHSVQEANLWLKAVAEELHMEERRHAYSALRAALHALRDRLAAETAVHLGAQLPMVIRGLFYEGWRIAGKPTDEHSVDAFCEHVAKELPPGFPMDPLTVTKGVLAVLSREIDAGEIAKVAGQLPAPLRELMPQNVG